MPPLLRPYQSTGLDRVRAAIAAGHRRVLLALPTGGGKTIMATEGIIKPAAALGNPVLFVAHRIELIEQCASKIDGLPVGIIKAGYTPNRSALVQVASVQTLARRELPPARIVIWDEAHRCMADTYKRIAGLYPDAVHLGLTATPYRTNGQGLKDCFDSLVEVSNIVELTNLGFLVPARMFSPPGPDLGGVRITAGDYNQAQLAERVDTPKLVGDIARTWQRYAHDRQTLVFATSVEHSRHLTAEFLAAGIPAAHLDGETPTDERAQIISDIGSGALRVVVNVGVLTEGTDIPAVSCIVLARPTQSRGLWRQMLGRGLRTHPGKTDCVILDHAGCYYAHGLVTDMEELSLKGVTRRPSQATPVRQCLSCYAVIKAGPAVCPECGVMFPVVKRSEIKHAEGELVETTVSRPFRKISFYNSEATEMNALVETAIRNGHKPAWIGFAFQMRFGRWPCSVKQLEAMVAEARE